MSLNETKPVLKYNTKELYKSVFQEWMSYAGVTVLL